MVDISANSQQPFEQFRRPKTRYIVIITTIRYDRHTLIEWEQVRARERKKGPFLFSIGIVIHTRSWDNRYLMIESCLCGKPNRTNLAAPLFRGFCDRLLNCTLLSIKPALLQCSSLFIFCRSFRCWSATDCVDVPEKGNARPFEEICKILYTYLEPSGILPWRIAWIAVLAIESSPSVAEMNIQLARACDEQRKCISHNNEK